MELSIYMTLDSKGREQYTLDAILDHKRDETAVPLSKKYIVTKSGNKRLRKSTVGWQVLVRWKDETKQWTYNLVCGLYY